MAHHRDEYNLTPIEKKLLQGMLDGIGAKKVSLSHNYSASAASTYCERVRDRFNLPSTYAVIAHLVVVGALKMPEGQ